MNPHPKPPRRVGRHAQLSKRIRLVKRALGQWKPQLHLQRSQRFNALDL